MKETKTKTVGLIGCGAIGTLIAQAIEKKIVNCDKLVLFDYQKNKAADLKASIDFPTTIVKNLEEMLQLKPSVIIEAASQKAAKDYIKPITTKNIHLIVMSTGALIDMKYQSKKLHVPSGAIGGLDAISSAALTQISEVILTTKKNPKAFEMDNTQPKIIYEGNADNAAKLYPKSMNVASTLSFIVKPTKVLVQLISDPTTNRNTHEIKIKWQFGQMLLCFSNDPHPENPRTSALAAWSAINLLKTLLEK
ncbi:MAG TPA: aspartate dehydrogenase [Candidatus Glassbacteria bacterium]|nr:aspartate dehydrogenase [Candidatus Glassbacteria bacterium]